MAGVAEGWSRDEASVVPRGGTPRGREIPIIWNGIDLINPFANPGVSNNCANYYGWYCDEETTGLLRQISDATTPQARRELADKLQIAFHRNVNVVLGGQFQGPPAFRSNLQGWVPFAFPVFWNIERR